MEFLTISWRSVCPVMITKIILDGCRPKKSLEAADAVTPGVLAIVHDDDLQIIKSKHLVRPNINTNSRADSYNNARTKETFTAYAVLKFLRENKIPVLIENGGK